MESELNKVWLQIEQITGRIQYIENRVELAAITVGLGEPEAWIAIPEMNWGKPVEAGLLGLFIVIQGIIALAIVATPVVAIGAPIYYIYKRSQKSEVSS